MMNDPSAWLKHYSRLSIFSSLIINLQAKTSFFPFIHAVRVRVGLHGVLCASASGIIGSGGSSLYLSN